MTLHTTVAERVSNLSRKSLQDHYNPYTHFDWPDAIPEDRVWMPVELLSLYGTPAFDTLTPDQVIALSKWESISFYSLNVHGIKDVLGSVVTCIHTSEFAHVSDYLHHFIGEENGHMWFFAEFCLRYGGKIYTQREMTRDTEPPRAIKNFLIFAQTVIFEEIVDYFNLRIGQDKTLDPIIQDVNMTHHKDESRHVAFGREIVRELHRIVVSEHGDEGAALAEAQIRRYLSHCLDLFYPAAAYRDAGLPEPFKLRNQARHAPERADYHRKMLARTTNFFTSAGFLTDGAVQ